ncbi:hypothetical protein EDB83DRAFT_2531030 [Lactarius deliciosus]|nr:hypothetical protein EDB83DRAFT_2531030 [Lactarius deliciosus]
MSAPTQATQGFIDGSGPIFSMYLEMAGKEDKKWSKVGKRLQMGSSYTRPALTQHPSEQRLTSSIAFAKDAGAAGFVAILQPPLGDTPVSRSARRTAQRCHAGNGQTSPSAACRFNQRPGRARAQEGSGNAPPPHPIRAGAFVLRVQALTADNCALMECLIRFAQAHDLLKKNAEHAQKLAQDSNAALETYQRQVRTLEEQLAMSDGLQEQVDQLAVEKLAVEERAAEQAEALDQLTEAKAVLSARALQLAEDPAPAQEELRAVNTVSEREQMQRLALLKEINVVQMENGSLRQQLRALGKL